MTPYDDPWADLPGTPGVAALLDAARGPATDDELAAEAEIVAAMLAVVAPAPEAAAPDIRRSHPVRRLLAAKGVVVAGVVAFGVAGAAAATGIVAGVIREDEPRPASGPTVTTTGSPPASGEDGDGVDGVGPVDPTDPCPTVIVACPAPPPTTAPPPPADVPPGHSDDPGQSQGQGQDSGQAQSQGDGAGAGQGQGTGQGEGAGQGQGPPANPGTPPSPPSTVPPPPTRPPPAGGAEIRGRGPATAPAAAPTVVGQPASGAVVPHRDDRAL